jgi:pantoate--beta-alanine ligase
MVDLVWAPPPEEVFPPGYQTWVTVEAVSAPLEGKHRPGHFRGVATLAARLFNAFTPDRAYFGQKDAQQVAVIHQMVRDLSFPLEIRVCPTVREPYGLAVSRRNADLDADERRAAVVLYRALVAAREAFRTGTREADMLRALMSSTLAAEPLAREEYVSVADPASLAELAQVDEARGALLSLAVRVGKTRLTDNQLLP